MTGFPTELVGRIEALNKKTLGNLVEQLRSPVGVIPFVGAGVCKPYELPEWGDLIRKVIAGGSAAAQAAVEQAIADKKFELAAGVTYEALGKEAFECAVASVLNEGQLDRWDFALEPVATIAFLAAGPVITTNFDRVLERAFKAADHPFEEIASGVKSQVVVRAVRQSRRVLWKLHGDILDGDNMVFSAEQYDHRYKQVRSLLRVALLNRPALFIGSSLDTDRTVEALKEVQAEHASIRHFAILPAPLSVAEFDTRLSEIQACGVDVLWYPKGEAAQEVPRWLRTLVQESAVRQPIRRAEPEPLPAFAPSDSAGALLARELAELRTNAASTGAAPRLPYTPMLFEVAAGKLAFFLGAGSLLGRLPLADEFYSRLADQLGLPTGQMEDAKLAQHFIDLRTNETIFALIDEMLRVEPHPSAIDWFIATLPARLRAKGRTPKPLMILTTNYSDWMESALTHAGERYHVFSYGADKESEGFFIHRDPDGNTRIIDRPSHFRFLSDESNVVVKLHGGLRDRIPLPRSYVFTRRGFVELAGRIPARIPELLLRMLDERTLLFLGSSLRDDGLEALVRAVRARAIASGRQPKSHLSVQSAPAPDDDRRAHWELHRKYWQPIGVDIIDATLESVVLAFDQAVETMDIGGRAT